MSLRFFDTAVASNPRLLIFSRLDFSGLASSPGISGAGFGWCEGGLKPLNAPFRRWRWG
jgi:hypothetical protein